MKATKKQIEDVREEARKAGFSEEKAIRTLELCSKSIYESIGPRGVVEASMKADSLPKNGDIPFADCSILGNTEKAFLLNIPFVGERWIAKSIITRNGDAYVNIPKWAVR